MDIDVPPGGCGAGARVNPRASATASQPDLPFARDDDGGGGVRVAGERDGVPPATGVLSWAGDGGGGGGTVAGDPNGGLAIAEGGAAPTETHEGGHVAIATPTPLSVEEVEDVQLVDDAPDDDIFTVNADSDRQPVAHPGSGTAASGGASTDDDFRSPPGKRKKLDGAASADEDDETIQCPICFEPWSTSGRHRVVSLKCGHLFGMHCIDKWLKGKGSNKCPQCNAKSKSTDIRPIFVKVVRAVDTSDEQSLRREIEKITEEKRRAERAEAAARIQFQILKTEHERLQARLREQDGAAAADHRDDQREAATAAASPGPAVDRAYEPRFVLETVVPLKQNKCRVIEYDARHAMLLCSGEGPANPFARGAGHGVVKVSALDPSHSEYIALHHNTIRDVRTCPDQSGVMLTVSQDKTAKLTSITSNTTVCSCALPLPSWTCCWNADTPTNFYVGLINSEVLEYDTRDTSQPVRTMTPPAGTPRKPLVSLHHLSSAGGFELRGVLAATLGGVALWDLSDPESPAHRTVPALEGACVWTAPHAASQHFVTTLRPSPTLGQPRVQHIVSRLTPDAATGVTCSVQGVLQGGLTQTALARSTLLGRPNAPDFLLLAASDEPTKTVKLWDVASGGMLQSLSCHGQTCTDIVTFRAGSRPDALAILTGSKLLVHTWR